MQAARHEFEVNELDGMAVQRARQPLGTGDSNGDVFAVALRDKNGAYTSLLGVTVKGEAIRADGQTVYLTGSVSGYYGMVTLTSACYAVPGDLELTIKMSTNTITRSVLRVKMDVIACTTEILATYSEGGGSIADLTGAIRYDIEQSLTDDQKARARANIGVTSTGADISGIIDDSTTSREKVWSSHNTLEWIADMAGGLSSRIGEMGELDTANKTSVVAAINEVNAKVGSGSGGSTPTDELRVECWGDSLTFGAGAAGSDYSYSEAYPAVLATKIGKTVYNYGVGGETSETILARMGATPMYVEQIYIPAAAGSASSVKLRSATGAEVAPLLQAASQDKGVNPVIIGGVPGTLAYSADSGYTFARTTAGTAVAHLTPVEVETAYMRTVNDNRVRIIWMGQNDIDDAEMGGDMAQLGQYLIEACRAAIRGVDKYIILTAPVSTGATATPYKPIHRAMVQAFGDHCINIVDYLIRYGLADAGLSATAQDNTDIAAYYIPESLRYDRVHLNAAGYGVVANQVYKRGLLLGYW